MSDEIIFEVDGLYRNRKGWYRVMQVSGDQMHVCYEAEGQKDILSVEIQKRIINNLSREEAEVSPIETNRKTFFFLWINAIEAIALGMTLSCIERSLIDTERAMILIHF